MTVGDRFRPLNWHQALVQAFATMWPTVEVAHGMHAWHRTTS